MEKSKLPEIGKPRQYWHFYNLASTQEKRLFFMLLDELCEIIPEPPHDNGRPPIKVRDLVFSGALKLYHNVSGRRISSDLKHAQEAGYITQAPHFNTLSDFFQCPATTELLQRLLTITALPLKNLENSFSIDSSGFATYQHFYYRQCKYALYDEAELKGWRKFLKGHICIGTRTNVIVSAQVTPENGADITQAPHMIQLLGDNFNAEEVSADKAYSSRRIMQLIESIGALPFIPFKDNAACDKRHPLIWHQMYKYFFENRITFLSHYHKRSNVETTFMMIKKKFGEHLRNKTLESQTNELLLKFICHNICCLISEIFESEVHVDFKKCVEEFIDRKDEPKEKTDAP